MDHKEIRNRIIFTLYKFHYTNSLNKLLNTKKVIEDSGLGYVEEITVYGDFIYLEEKGYIVGKNAVGYSYPLFVRISPSGIDKAEEIMDSFISFLKESENDEIRILYDQFEAIQSENARLEHLQWIINVKNPDAFSKFSKIKNFFAF